MNILFSIHLYPPNHLCGAEWMAHRIIKHLQSKGHHIRVLLHQANHYRITNNYCWDGVDVFPPNQNVIDNLFRWSHAVFTHLDYTRWSIGAATLYKKPLFHLIHNTHNYPEIADSDTSQHVVYNSKWAKEKLGYKWSNFILTPPIDYREFDIDVDTADNQYITLINTNENKGGKIFEEIARAMPHKKFLGVEGSYDNQITANLPNITYIKKTADILSVYKQTRILLMPSKYESWGMTATEAMCCGIPVVSSEAEGLKENCAKAGIFVKDRDDIKSWVNEINKLDDAKAYAAASRKVKARGREQDPRKALDEFETWFRENVNRYNK